MYISVVEQVSPSCEYFKGTIALIHPERISGCSALAASLPADDRGRGCSRRPTAAYLSWDSYLNGLSPDKGSAFTRGCLRASNRNAQNDIYRSVSCYPREPNRRPDPNSLASRYPDLLVRACPSNVCHTLCPFPSVQFSAQLVTPACPWPDQTVYFSFGVILLTLHAVATWLRIS